MGAAKNVALEPLPCALGVAAFLHNVIIVHPRFCFEIGFSLCTIMPHYVTKLGEKKLLAQVAKMYVSADAASILHGMMLLY
jgi:hypothetical protein